MALVDKKPHVIIATPGRILYHLENTKGFNLNNLKYLVLDEADKLLNMKLLVLNIYCEKNYGYIWVFFANLGIYFF